MLRAELREQVAEAVRRARDAAAEAAHAQATVRSRDADLRDLEMQLSGLMLSKRGGGGGGGGGGRGGGGVRHDARAHLRTTTAVPPLAPEPKGGNDMEQAYPEWIGRLSPRAALGGWLRGGGDHDASSVPLPPTLHERCGPLLRMTEGCMQLPSVTPAVRARAYASEQQLARHGGPGTLPFQCRHITSACNLMPVAVAEP